MKEEKTHALKRNHKAFFILFGLLLLCFLPLTAFALKGDANGDGKVNIVDALVVAQYSAGAFPPCEWNCSDYDVNCDGTININDALIIARYTAQFISEFTCGSFTPTPIPTPTPTPTPTPLTNILELTITYESTPAYNTSVFVSPPGVTISGLGVHLISYPEPISVTLTGSEYWYDTDPGVFTSVETLFPDWDDNPNDGKPRTMMKYVEGYTKVTANFIHASAFYPTPTPMPSRTPTPVPTITPIPSPPYILQFSVNRDFTLSADDPEINVTLSPPGVTVATSRTIVFNEPTMVYLHAKENNNYYYGYVLSSWSGILESSSGTTAAVYVDRTKAVTATFTKKALH